jgi:hypothetical protein
MAVVHNLGGAGLLPAPSATGTCWRSDDAAAARHGVDEASGPVKLAVMTQIERWDEQPDQYRYLDTSWDTREFGGEKSAKQGDGKLEQGMRN